ncbi:MAG: HAD hydrolase-like protein [Fibrobacter sp.]|nr:HAD hydrolase-like protein [Fibrobacter sp.]
MLWLFDYDLTLYGTEERRVLQSLDHRISLFVQKVTNVEFDEAAKIRTEYLYEYGTTLAGLQARHNVHPDDFFDFIHEPKYLIYPKYSEQKKALLQSVEGTRYVFTNGRGDWSDAGLRNMGIRACFEQIFDIHCMDWIGKPNESAYQKMEAFLRLRHAEYFDDDGMLKNPREIIMVEDSLRNLEMAHKRGWMTVWVNPTTDVPDWLDFCIPHILNLPEVLAKLDCVN